MQPTASPRANRREKGGISSPMKLIVAVVLLGLLGPRSPAEVPMPELEKLVAKLGSAFWSPPEKRLVRATVYGKGKAGDDPQSRKGKSDEHIGLLYACKETAGTLAVPQWLPRGSMVKIHTQDGVLSFIAADEGSGVESRAAAKGAGKTEEEKAASVLDFCAAKQLWPDFVIVEIYYYAGKIPFGELTMEEQKILFSYAMEYVTKRE